MQEPGPTPSAECHRARSTVIKEHLVPENFVVSERGDKQSQGVFVVVIRHIV